MKIQELKEHVSSAINAHRKEIRDHLLTVLARGKTTGIEGIFSAALNTELKGKGVNFRTELSLGEVGVRQFYEGRARGRVDTFLPDSRTAFECKAVRLPREKSSPKFDLGQLLADYLRLRSGSSLGYGYLVIFVYGAVVGEASSPGSLYRRFHNQMFVDQDLARQTGSLSRDEIEAVNELEWNRAWGSSHPPTYAAAIAVNDFFGAICISVFEEC
jgi:hypothetical protein